MCVFTISALLCCKVNEGTLFVLFDQKLVYIRYTEYRQKPFKIYLLVFVKPLKFENKKILSLAYYGRDNLESQKQKEVTWMVFFFVKFKFKLLKWLCPLATISRFAIVILHFSPSMIVFGMQLLHVLWKV